MNVLTDGGAGSVGTTAAQTRKSVLVADIAPNQRDVLSAPGERFKAAAPEIIEYQNPAGDNLLRASFAGVDLVYRLVAQASAMIALEAPQGAFETNVAGIYHLLRLAREQGVRRVV